MSLINQLAKPALCLHLGPHRLSGALRRRGQAVAGGAVGIDYANPDGGWEAALNALNAYLASNPRRAVSRALPICLASRWCPATMAPWSDAMLDHQTAEPFLRAQMLAQFGEMAQQWVCVGDNAPYGQPRLVCGIDRSLLQALRQSAARHGRVCNSVESLLTVAWRIIGSQRPQAFALIEPGQLTLATAARGRINALLSHPCPPDWAPELALAWHRWTLRAPASDTFDEVAVVDLSGMPRRPLAAPFHYAAALPANWGPAQLVRVAPWA